MFDHVGFEVRDYEKSRKFYLAALAPLGVELIREFSEMRVAGFGKKQRPQFWIMAGSPSNGKDEVHVCFAAASRAEVRAFYDAALRAGGRDNGAPGLRPEYHANYFGAFILDPDGHGIEACCHQPE